MEVKSVITRPAPGITLKGPGFYEISGLAWSGNGSIRQVEVSADGGRSWAPAALQGPILAKAPVRFRAPWQWNGGPAVLQSRATDDTGMVQPTRAAFAAERGLRGVYHYNAIASWRIDEKGEATQCLCVNGSQSARRMIATAVPRPGAERPQFGQADRARRHRGLGHQHRSRRRRASARPRHRQRRARRSTPRSVRPATARRARAARTTRSSAASARSRPASAGEDGRQLLAVRDDAVRLHPARDAVAGTKSLTNDEVYAVSAYILNLNGIVGTDDVLDAQSLPKVRMPNRDGFIPFPRNPK